ncbi:MAG TPA: DUF559 domain-containing protein [Candidatus Dormibacteraeota bacterium]|jgi:hypothetical protein
MLVARRILIPAELAEGPFDLAEAADAGVRAWQLRAKTWQRLGPGLYAPARIADAPLVRLAAALRRLPPEAVFAARTATWLHGLDIEPCDPIEVIVPEGSGVSGRVGMSVSRAQLQPEEVESRQSLPLTSIRRTLVDIGRRLALIEAVVIADMALHAGLIDKADLAAAVHAQGGSRNVASLRRMVQLAEPRSESALESRLRLILVLAGLPAPLVQVNVYDDHGEFLGRPDLLYPAERLYIEYDGGTHRQSLAADNRRQNRLLAARYRPLRYTAADVLHTPAAIVAQVRAALAESQSSRRRRSA